MMGSITKMLLLILLSGLSMHFALAANSSSSNSNSIRCRESERKALLEFKASLVNDASRLSSWRGHECCSNWFGITCHNSTGQVQMLDLGFTDEYTFNFSSSLSSWLFNLSRLESLRIHGSSLQGPIPNMFEKLTSLIYLDLSDNLFYSPFPDSICSLTSLSEMYIRGSKLKGALPPCIGNMASLTEMDLRYNELSGKIPSELGYLTNLTGLDLSYNHLNSSIPPTLGHLTKLTRLSLFDNSLMGELPESCFEGLSSLDYLDISGNKRIFLNLSSKWIPPFQMRDVNMAGVFVGPEFLLWLQTQRNLERLYMSDANISGEFPGWFHSQSTFPNLESIDLSNNFLTGSLPTFDISLSILYLLLPGNQLSGNIPQELCNLKSLKYLHLGNNQLVGTIPPCLGSLHNLSELDLGDNNLSGHIPNELGSLSNLLSLHLYGNKLSGKFPESLLKLESLYTLDLGENEIQGSIPQWTGIRWPVLQYMRLESNNISGEIPVNLCQLQSLHILNLALNNFVGTIPPCLGNLIGMMSEELGMKTYYGDALVNNIKGMETMYTSNLPYAKFLSVSGNHLYGRIPAELMNLKGLQSLNLSNNELTGMIPQTINNLTQLESLDLSGNQLSGNIPQTLAEIDALGYLNLSFNNLGGRIPSGNHFDTLDDPSIYRGNEELCGKPLMKSCAGDRSAISNQPSGAVSDGDDEFNRLPWVYAGIGPGFAVGFLGVICTLYFKDEWRVAFFGFTQKFG